MNNGTGSISPRWWAYASTAADAGRRPLVWDNFPVNDALMSPSLHMGPLWGRDADLADECSGYLANPMVQPHASLLPLAGGIGADFYVVVAKVSGAVLDGVVAGAAVFLAMLALWWAVPWWARRASPGTGR